MNQQRAKLIFLAMLGAIVAYLGYELLERRAEEERQRASLEVQQKRQQERVRADQAEQELLAKMPRPDVDMTNRLPRTYPRPESAWRSSEKAFYESLLSQRAFDVLVVPFQVQDHAFSLDIRSLMTARLAMAMAAGSQSKASIPDPYLVGRALGEGQRRYELKDVFRLANALKVSRVVLGFVGHNGANEMRLTMHYYDRAPHAEFGSDHASREGKGRKLVPSPALRGQHYEKLAFGDAQTPDDVVVRLLPEILRFLASGAGAVEAESAKRAGALHSMALPDSLQAMVAAHRSPAQDAYYFQLLAALAPSSAERTRSRLTEKSMLAIPGLSVDSPDYRALRARALMNMGLRPAALRVLDHPASAEERHLVAMLNGDLPGVRAARAQIPAGIRAVIAALEENAMATAYGARTRKDSLAEVARLGMRGDSWKFLAARAMTDWDVWSQHENLSLKALLELEFPVPGVSARSMLEGSDAMSPSKLQASLDFSVLNHVRTHLTSNACCDALTAHPAAHDALDLIEAIATDNLVRRARFMANIQGLPDEALSYLARMEGVYRDHPQFLIARGEAQMALANGAEGADRNGLLSAAYVAGFNAWYWEQGQTRTATDGFDLVAGTGVDDFGMWDNAYIYDYPARSFYTEWEQKDLAAQMRNSRRALENATYDMKPVASLAWSLGQLANRWDEVDRLLQSIEHRFVGHPKHVTLKAESKLRQGDARAAEQLYREATRAQPSDEKLYAALGNLLFDHGATDRARTAYMSYPGLRATSGSQSVAVSNYAYEAGSRFYRAGELEGARALYRIAADLQTGSWASIVSRARLRLLDHDHGAALESFLVCARRYDSTSAYRDYFGLMHAAGRGTEAWEGFMNLVQRDDPLAWETVLVGHRLGGASEEQIATWLKAEPMKSAGVGQSYAAMYMLRAGTIDRLPTAQLPMLIAELDRPVWRVEHTPMEVDSLGRITSKEVKTYVNVVRESRDGLDHLVLGPNAPRVATLARGLLQLPTKERVKSDYVFFADAYRAIHARDFDGARRALQEASTLYDVRQPSLGYLLPYYAYAAARSGDTASVEALLETFPESHRRFAYHLAQGVLHGIGKRNDEAMRHLRLARHRGSATGTQPVYTEYQFAELSEWLFEATGSSAYRALALDWARKNQLMQPWFAWAYAVEAHLSRDPGSRRRAMATAHYLDRNSYRLSRLPRKEVDAAVKEYAGRNPFLRPKSLGHGGRA